MQNFNLKKLFRNEKNILNILLSDIGIYQVENDKIICYVDNKKLAQKLEKSKNANLILPGTERFNNLNEESKSKLAKMNIGTNNQIYYVIDNMEFNNLTVLSSCNNTNIIFKNCSFYQYIKITSANNITFENNKYYCFKPMKKMEQFLQVDCPVNNLQFIRENFMNSGRNQETNFGIAGTIKNLELINSNIIANKPGTITMITTGTTTLTNSSMIAPEIYLDSTTIIGDKTSQISALDGMIIESKRIVEPINLLSPYIIYNGYNISNPFGKIEKFSDEDFELYKARRQIIKTFKNISLLTNNQIEKEIEQFRRTRKKQSIKTLIKERKK